MGKMKVESGQSLLSSKVRVVEEERSRKGKLSLTVNNRACSEVSVEAS